MMMICEHEDKIFSTDHGSFESLALEIFNFQYNNNAIYRKYVNALQKVGEDVHSLVDIPFLPIQFFKAFDVKTTEFEPEAIFESSGTTGSLTSKHLVKKRSIYEKSFHSSWEQFYGPLTEWCIIGLLPSYLERSNSSLVLMAKEMIAASNHPDSGFYLYEYSKLSKVLSRLETAGQKTLLLGVTFALLDFAEVFPMPLKNTIVVETGGMKGRREELTRQEVHERLKKAFNLTNIHSEYGMTELLSQAWSQSTGLFHCPPWMKIMLRQEDDPFSISSSGTGVINVIDLANLYSCAFIATDDAGKLNADGSFEVLGRIDNSDLRGCSLLAV
jgi:phenylacetate-coenzyme A ligase PaaK-like adenylate-forming protein